MDLVRLVLVHPIDSNGFVIWTSERYRFEEVPYEPLPDEIVVPIPPEATWVQPRWSGDGWVEGLSQDDIPRTEGLVSESPSIAENKSDLVDLIRALIKDELTSGPHSQAHGLP